MKFHIVRNQETTKEILQIYSLSINELKEVNRHVRDWNKLIPGTKLKIPIINEAIEQDIIDMEPFVEDYYPRNDEPLFQEKEEDNIQSEIVENDKEIIIEETKDNTLIKEDSEKTKEVKEEPKILNKNPIRKDNIRNMPYVWYQPYVVYYPVYIKVK